MLGFLARKRREKKIQKQIRNLFGTPKRGPSLEDKVEEALLRVGVKTVKVGEKMYLEMQSRKEVGRRIVKRKLKEILIGTRANARYLLTGSRVRRRR